MKELAKTGRLKNRIFQDRPSFIGSQKFQWSMKHNAIGVGCCKLDIHSFVSSSS